jgi:hypothetical protein
MVTLIESRRLIPTGTMQSVWLLALALTLAPGAREQFVDASGKHSNGEPHPARDRFSFSPPGRPEGVRGTVNDRTHTPAQNQRRIDPGTH